MELLLFGGIHLCKLKKLFSDSAKRFTGCVYSDDALFHRAKTCIGSVAYYLDLCVIRDFYFVVFKHTESLLAYDLGI